MRRSPSHGAAPDATAEARVVPGPLVDAELRVGWGALAEARGNPFITPEWFDAWRATGPATSEAIVVEVRRRGGLIGVVPLAVERGRFGGRIQPPGSWMGDCFHPASLEQDELEVAHAAGSVLGGLGWSSIEILNGLLSSSWSSELTSCSGATGAAIAQVEQQLPFVELAGSDWDAFLASRSRNFRKGLWRMQRRLAEQGETTFRLADEAGLERDLHTLRDLHGKRWGPDSIFLSRQSVRFHERFARLALERGWLRLGILSLDGRPIASTYGWLVGDRFSEYQRGYDPALGRFGPGKLVMAEMMRSVGDEGAAIFDQLLGDERYKLQIADGVRTVQSVRAARPRRPAGVAIRAERMARYLYGRAPSTVRDAVRARRYPTAE
jgi:CelD/BcsL family acetyltransferase involved in cellulose biosynthesis